MTQWAKVKRLKLLVLGATGQLGQMLQWAWANQADLAPVWQSRRSGSDFAIQGSKLRWVIGDPLTPGSCLLDAMAQADVIVNLLGVTPGHEKDLSLNTSLALSPFQDGIETPVMIASSAAIYGIADDPFHETDVPFPINAYGRAKLKMEQAVLAAPGPQRRLILRIGNVAGADALLGGVRPGVRPQLHQFKNGSTPRRSYISPNGLADALAAMARQVKAWPDIVNVAAPGSVTMGDLLTAAGCGFDLIPAPPTVPQTVAFDTHRLTEFIAPQALAHTPEDLIAQWQNWETWQDANKTHTQDIQ